MVAPYTSVHTQTRPSPVYSEFKTWIRQAKPYTDRLPCYLWKARQLSSEGNASSWARSDTDSPLWTSVQNKARERFVAELGDTAQIGSLIAAEWRSSTEMVAKRAMQLYKFTRALRKGRFNEASTILGVTTPGKAVRKFKTRDFGGAWLEYSYGWAPLVSDIYGACQIVDKPPQDIQIRGRARGSKDDLDHSPPPYSFCTDVFWSHKCQMIADVRVTNPNLYLSNQLGLTNPAQWVLEGIPFSFVVDWFSNLSQWVSQLTDFLGCDLIQPMTTHTVQCREHVYLIYPSGYHDRGDKVFNSVRRTRGIPSVTLSFEYEVFDWKRGLNAVSLLTQALRSF